MGGLRLQPTLAGAAPDVGNGSSSPVGREGGARPTRDGSGRGGEMEMGGVRGCELVGGNGGGVHGWRGGEEEAGRRSGGVGRGRFLPARVIESSAPSST